jgi:hypothetical protein
LLGDQFSVPHSLKRYEVHDYSAVTPTILSVFDSSKSHAALDGKVGEVLHDELRPVGLDFGEQISKMLGEREDSGQDYCPVSEIISVFHPLMRTTEREGIWWQGLKSRKVMRIDLKPEIILATRRRHGPSRESRDFIAMAPTALVNVDRPSRVGTTLGAAPLGIEAATVIDKKMDGPIDISKNEGVVGSGQLAEAADKDRELRKTLKKARNDVKNHLFPKEHYTTFEWEVPFKCQVIPIHGKTLVCVQSAPEYNLRLRDVQSSVRIWDYRIQKPVCEVLERVSNLIQQIQSSDSVTTSTPHERTLVEYYLRENGYL